jgi:hypothetical protein
MAHESKTKPLYTRYPLPHIITYNGITLLHFALGILGIYMGIGWLLALLYGVFAFAVMYIMMPLKVCPNCVYYRLDNSRCISGLNLLSKKITYEGLPINFSKRAKGWLCHNNYYLAGLILPLPLILIGMLFNFSVTLVGIFVAIAALLAFRFFVLFPKIACVNCAAKYKCPNAAQMGLNK